MPVLVKRDGQTVAEVEDSNAAFVWLLSHQPQSVSWAIRYEGYTVTDEAGAGAARVHQGRAAHS
jgi:hypothetical protein